MAAIFNTTSGIVYVVGWTGSISGGSAVLTGDLTVGAANAVIWSGESMIKSPADGNLTLLNNAGTNFTMLQFGGTSGSFPGLKANGGSELAFRTAADGADGNARAGDFFTNNGSLTNGSGTGVTVNSSGAIRHQIYKITVLNTQYIAAALTSDLTLVTLPAKTMLLGVFADLTTTFAGTAGTLAMTVGSSVAGTDILVSFDVKTATLQRGLADADLGTSLTRATAVQAGKVFSWASTTPVSLRLTSGTGNLGTGAATNLSQGSITFYLVTVRLP